MAPSDNEKGISPVADGGEVHEESDTDKISETAQAGVQKIEATTKVWTKTALIVAYIMYVLCLTLRRSSGGLGP